MCGLHSIGNGESFRCGWTIFNGFNLSKIQISVAISKYNTLSLGCRYKASIRLKQAMTI